MEINISKLKTYAENISVLYVEDDEIIQEEMTRVLSRFFPKVDLAQNGEDGLHSYNENPYDLVISDINMPIMNGIEMIKELNKYEDSPVILVTSAYNDTDYLMQLINLNITKFVMKPFNAKDFLIGLYYIVEQIFFKKEYAIMQEKLKLSNQTLEQMQEKSEHATIILEKNKIKYANSAFLKLSKYDDLQTLKDESPQIGTLFDLGYNCIQDEDNKDFIDTLKNSEKSKHLVQRYDENKKNPTIYAVNFTEGSEKEALYLLSFTEITPFLEPYKFDRTTKLPNRIFMFEEIECIRQEYTDVFAMALSIKHFSEYATWKGKQGAKDFERLIANQISGLLQKQDFNNIFLARFSINQFVLLSSSSLETVEPYLNDLSLHPLDLDKDKQNQKQFSFTPLHKFLTFPIDLDTETLEIQLVNTFDELHF
ncbi:MAG: hypothetical protein COA44_03730 [Arcobacter sp.]|nr:MAG: hypothetical protein COA44_03730 [Arcobacter sp.]